MSFEGMTGYSITIEKDGYNETVSNTKKYRLYIGDRLLESFDYYNDLKMRLNKLMDGSFE